MVFVIYDRHIWSNVTELLQHGAPAPVARGIRGHLTGAIRSKIAARWPSLESAFVAC